LLTNTGIIIIYKSKAANIHTMHRLDSSTVADN